MFNPKTKKYEEEDQRFNIHPHWLRHSRLTHMVNIYKYNVPQLVEFAGWTDPKPAMIYIRMRPEDLITDTMFGK